MQDMIKDLTHLEFVSNTDEAQLSGLGVSAMVLLGVLGVVGVFKEFPHEPVLGFAHQALEGHVQRVVILLHKLGLKIAQIQKPQPTVLTTY